MQNHEINCITLIDFIIHCLSVANAVYIWFIDISKYRIHVSSLHISGVHVSTPSFSFFIYIPYKRKLLVRSSVSSELELTNCFIMMHMLLFSKIPYGLFQGSYHILNCLFEIFE